MSRNAHNNKNCKKEIMLANLANMAKMTILPQSPTTQSTKQYRGPIKVGKSGEFGKYGENDNFATIANEEKHKAVKGAHKSLRKRRIWQIHDGLLLGENLPDAPLRSREDATN